MKILKQNGVHKRVARRSADHTIKLKLVVVSVVVFGSFWIPGLLNSFKKNNKVDATVPQPAISQPTTESAKSNNLEPTRPAAINIGNGFVPVTDSVYNQNEKQLVVPSSSVAWLTDSPMINSSGATLIYGHNSDQFFAKLNNFQDGQQVVIQGQDGHEYKFRKTKSTEVSPSDTSVLYNLTDRKENLILITCSQDYFNSKRVITYFARENP